MGHVLNVFWDFEIVIKLALMTCHNCFCDHVFCKVNFKAIPIPVTQLPPVCDSGEVYPSLLSVATLSLFMLCH